MFDVREIKFHNSLSNPFTVFGDFGEGLDSEDCILMQSTGLRDKNGKEIFEGDIIEFDYGRGGGFTRCREQVLFDRGKFGFWGSPLNDFNYDAVLIGNVHQNPDLLPMPE